MWKLTLEIAFQFFKEEFRALQSFVVGFVFCDKRLLVIVQYFCTVYGEDFSVHLEETVLQWKFYQCFFIWFLQSSIFIIQLFRAKTFDQQGTFSYRGPFLYSVKDSRPSNAFVEKERFKTCTEVCCIFLFQQSNFSHSFRKMKFMCTFIRRKYNLLFVCIRLNLFLGIAYVT